MKAIFRCTKAEQNDRHAVNYIDPFDNRYRTAHSDEHSLFTEAFRITFRRLLDEWMIRLDFISFRRKFFFFHFHFYARWGMFMNMFFQQFLDFFRILSWNEATCDFRRRFSRYDRFCTFPLVSAVNSVDFKSRPSHRMLLGGVTFFRNGFGNSRRLDEIFTRSLFNQFP